MQSLQSKIESALPALKEEIWYQTARSGGAGGQHVNKVSTKAILHWKIEETKAFNANEIQRILQYFKSKLTKEGVLQISCSDTRSQITNKERALKRLTQLLSKALFVPKKRKPSTPSKAAKADRLKAKRIQSEKKKNRRVGDW